MFELKAKTVMSQGENEERSMSKICKHWKNYNDGKITMILQNKHTIKT